MIAEIGSSIVFAILSALVLFVGWRKGFFISVRLPWIVPVHFLHVIAVFAIYFLITIASSEVFRFLAKKQMLMTDAIGLSTWFSFINSSLIACGLAIFLFIIQKKIRQGICRRPFESGHKISEDLWFALFAWAIAFPLVLFFSQALELLIYSIFNITSLPDQVAVKFLKMTFKNPLYLLLSATSIIVLAPLIEETLFRGFLQTFIRQHLGPRQAILITSLLFSCFHYSAEQGLGNIPIIGSLFILALFLGYLYERQGSLIAPIALHASFNAISVMNIYFLGGFSVGI
jgi:membrane protease YdiL (CAAX protease family)